MDIQIEGRHLEVTPAIRKRVENKVEKLKKFFDGLLNVHVVLAVEKHQRHRAELICHVTRGRPLVGKAENGDLYAAFDDAVDKAKEGLKKYKELMRVEPRRTTSSRFEAVTEPPGQKVDDDDDDDGDGDGETGTDAG